MTGASHGGTGSLGYAIKADRYYKVIVVDKSDDHIRSVIGIYSNASNAVFGALRRLGFDRTDPVLLQLWCELLPPRPQRKSKAGYMRYLRETHESL